MSSRDFRDLFNNPAFRYWYEKELKSKSPSTTSFVGIGRQDAKPFVRSSVGDFILSRDQLEEIFEKNIVDKIIDNAKKNTVELFDVVSYRNIAGQEQLVFPDIKFDSANKEITRLLGIIGGSVDSNKITYQIDKFFEKNPQDIGHIFGFTNTLLIRAKVSAREALTKEAERRLSSAKSINDSRGIAEANQFIDDTKRQLDALDAFIDSMVEVLEEYDIESSRIKGLDLEINSKYRKTANKWAFTWEASAEQQKVGSKLATILGNITQTKIGGKGIRGIFATLSSKGVTDSVVSTTLNNFIQEFIDKSIAAPDSSKLALLQQKGSPSMLELIEDAILASLGQKRKFNKVYDGSATLKPIPLLRIKQNSSNTKQEIRKLKDQKNKIKVTANKIEKERRKINTASLSKPAVTGVTNLLSLQNLINKSLHDQIKQNMGSGTRGDVLNYRTGRFAKSAKVEKLSESRQGMITAFYSYMKNPYATFSAGGRQEFPRSRDPKLLISKSIRELAAEQVKNRLRAVAL